MGRAFLLLKPDLLWQSGYCQPPPLPPLDGNSPPPERTATKIIKTSTGTDPTSTKPPINPTSNQNHEDEQRHRCNLPAVKDLLGASLPARAPTTVLFPLSMIMIINISMLIMIMMIMTMMMIDGDVFQVSE